MKQILIMLFVAIGCAQSTLAMEPEAEQFSDQDEQIEDTMTEQEILDQQLLDAIGDLPAAGPLRGDGPFDSGTNVKELLNAGADANTQQANGVNALETAARRGQALICKLLIERGADIQYQNCRSLIWAAESRDETVCKLLLEHGAKINTPLPQDNITIISLLARCSNPQWRALLRPLITYARFDPIRIVQELEDSEQRTALALWTLKNARPQLPRDVCNLILLTTSLREDACNSAFGIHRNQHNRVPFLPMQVVRSLLREKMLKPDETAAAMKEYACACLRPILIEAVHDRPEDTKIRDQVQASAKELLNPDNVVKVFGDEIEDNIRRRLELTKFPKIMGLISSLRGVFSKKK